jgi:hypothetical protein
MKLPTNNFLPIIAVLSLVIGLTHTQICLDISGRPVDWWIVLKVPPMTGNTGYGYYDSNTKTGEF